MRSADDVSESWSRIAGQTRSSRAGLLTATLVILATLVVPALLVMSAQRELLAWDVRFAYLPAAEAVLDGQSPYPALDDPILEDQKGYVYPPQLVLALLPLTPVPVDILAALIAAALLVTVGLALWVVGIRDVRCYAAALLWMPSISGVLLANLSIPFAFALAIAWRYRDTVWRPGFALGLSVSTKFLLWPMFVWMLATRRARPVLAAILVGVAVTLSAWTAIGFDGLREYPDLLQRLSEIQSHRSYSLVGMATSLGLSERVGGGVALVVGIALITACAVFARRDDDVRSFTCAVGATLALSPIVWLHYLVTLLVPVAIARPRFSAIWLLPVLLWVSPRPGYAEGLATFAPGVAAAIVLGVLLARPRPARPASIAAA